jgi:formate-dependent nitrite reductase membrane component NrfD
VSLVGTIAGFFLAGYTGVLLSNSAMPLWREGRLMGALFLASGASTGMAALSLLLFLGGDAAGEGYRKVKRADRFAMIVELVIIAGLLGVLGASAAPLTSGQFAPLFWGGLVVAGLLVPLVLDLAWGKVKVLGAFSAALVLIGGFILRYVIVMVNA